MKTYDVNHKVNGVIRLLAKIESSTRKAEGLPPIDKDDPLSIEFIRNRSIYFIKHGEKASIQDGHEVFLALMKLDAWVCGSEDIKSKTFPNLFKWDDLSQNTKNEFILQVEIINNACAVYETIKEKVRRESSRDDTIPKMADGRRVE